MPATRGKCLGPGDARMGGQDQEELRGGGLGESRKGGGSTKSPGVVQAYVCEPRLSRKHICVCLVPTLQHPPKENSYRSALLSLLLPREVGMHS